MFYSVFYPSKCLHVPLHHNLEKLGNPRTCTASSLLRQPDCMASMSPHRLLSEQSHRIHIRVYYRPSYTTPSFMAPANGVKFHSISVKVRGCQRWLNYLCSCDIFCQNGQFPTVALWWIIELIMHVLNNRVYVKLQQRRWKESQPQQRALLGACVTGGYRKGKKRRQKGRHMTGFLFCQGLPLKICGTVLLYVEYRDGAAWTVAAKTCRHVKEAATLNIKVPALCVVPQHTYRCIVRNTEANKDADSAVGARRYLAEHFQFSKQTFLFAAN